VKVKKLFWQIVMFLVIVALSGAVFYYAVKVDK